MPQSPYIDRLELAIAQSRDPAQHAMRRAELAACLARSGEFDVAEREIAGLRAEFGDGRSGRTSIMIMCAEAQLIYYRSPGEKARDRLLRAQLLSIAGRDAPLSALTSAWLAHVSFNLHRHDEMVRAAKTCLDTISSADHDAASRLALTLGNAFCVAEQPQLAQRWYMKAHHHAVRLGDHSTIGACLYNRAALGTFTARLRAAESPVETDAIVRLHSEVRSAITYQALTKMTSLQPLLDHALASVHILAGRHAEAIELLERLAREGAGSSTESSLLLPCDLALCLAQVGRPNDALKVMAPLPADALADHAAHEQVVAAAALAQAARICQVADRQAAAEERLASARAEHKAVVATLRDRLDVFAQAESLQRI